MHEYILLAARHTKSPDAPNGLRLVRVVLLLRVSKERMYKDSVVQIREIEARALLVVHLE